MLLSDLDDAIAEVWPDNWTVSQVFIAMSTQWRAGMGGPTGLDYSALPAVMRFLGVPQAERTDVFECLRVMEGEALRVMGE